MESASLKEAAPAGVILSLRMMSVKSCVALTPAGAVEDRLHLVVEEIAARAPQEVVPDHEVLAVGLAVGNGDAGNARVLVLDRSCRPSTISSQVFGGCRPALSNRSLRYHRSWMWQRTGRP